MSSTSDSKSSSTSSSSSRGSSSSSSASSTSSSACALQTGSYSLPDDHENADWAANGTDPDTRRRRRRPFPDVGSTDDPKSVPLFKRENARYIAANLKGCDDAKATSPNFVKLNAGTYLTVGSTPSTSLSPHTSSLASKPPGAIQEHVFELGYINQFFSDAPMNALDCQWIVDNIFQYRRSDGSLLGDVILAAMDNINNMVCHNPEQANSNVVNRNKETAADPPQSQKLRTLALTGDFGNLQTQKNITDMEFFLRSQGALGTYFSDTATTFLNTALQVQNLLAEITPTQVPDPTLSIPGIFNEWLENLIDTYPSGYQLVSSQGNMEYVQVVDDGYIPADEPPVPNCYPLYNGNTFNSTSFTASSLIPAAPTSAKCNIPGTKGSVVGLTSGPELALASNQIVMGSGNTGLYALGPGSTLSGSHWKAFDLSATGGSSCQGSYQMRDTTDTTGTSVYIDLSCGKVTGNTKAPFLFSSPILKLPECAVVDVDNGKQYVVICGSSTTTVQSCAQTIALAQYSNSAGQAVPLTSMALNAS
ncbi:hypothetical protein C8R44DRAFT_989954 [Mycena epipterygia]|nr:hypothetical protein C8R44DRAFT_989954 [Mycena epipterygia]